jgi:hypothetical protein
MSEMSGTFKMEDEQVARRTAPSGYDPGDYFDEMFEQWGNQRRKKNELASEMFVGGK